MFDIIWWNNLLHKHLRLTDQILHWQALLGKPQNCGESDEGDGGGDGVGGGGAGGGDGGGGGEGVGGGGGSGGGCGGVAFIIFLVHHHFIKLRNIETSSFFISLYFFSF